MKLSGLFKPDRVSDTPEELGQQLLEELVYSINRWKDTFNAPKVLKLIEAGARLDLADDNGCTALHLAVTEDRGGVAIVEALLRAGADPDRPDKYGRTPLMEAACRGKAAHMKALLDAGAATDLRDKSDHTALMMAIDHPGCICALAAGDADLNLQNNDGDTALHLAACDRGSLPPFFRNTPPLCHPESVAALLKARARRDLRNKDGDTPQQRAKRTGQPVTEALLKKADEDYLRETNCRSGLGKQLPFRRPLRFPRKP